MSSPGLGQRQRPHNPINLLHCQRRSNQLMHQRWIVPVPSTTSTTTNRGIVRQCIGNASCIRGHTLSISCRHGFGHVEGHRPSPNGHRRVPPIAHRVAIIVVIGVQAVDGGHRGGSGLQPRRPTSRGAARAPHWITAHRPSTSTSTSTSTPTPTPTSAPHQPKRQRSSQPQRPHSLQISRGLVEQPLLMLISRGFGGQVIQKLLLLLLRKLGGISSLRKQPSQ